MKKLLFNPLRGIVNLLLFVLFTVFISVSSYLVSLFVYPCPCKKLREKGISFLYRFPTYWIDLLSIPIWLASRGKWDIQGEPVNKQLSNLLVSNHQNALDILVLSYVFHRKTSTIKFFAKRELIWTLPFAGLSMWLMGYPLLRRNSRKEALSRKERKSRDIETTHRICQGLIKNPTTLINYAEGTRFTEAKRIRKNSPYKHLLTPKAGGIAAVINVMKYDLGGIIDCTIAYAPKKLSLWDFFSGNFDKITCHYQVIPIEAPLLGNYQEDRDYRKRFQAWLNALWRKKDEYLDKLKSA